MIIVGEALISEEIFEEHFVCDLNACKGACCIEGESGAPLDPEETALLEGVLPHVLEYMTEEGRQVVKEQGVYLEDEDGDLVTPLVSHHGACAFVYYDEKSIAKCALEKAFLEGKTEWKKPISCHLYPIRLTHLKEYIGLNYHRWPICAPACTCGSALQVPVFRFLKEPIIRRFGETFYSDLEEVFEVWKKERSAEG